MVYFSAGRGMTTVVCVHKVSLERGWKVASAAEKLASDMCMEHLLIERGFVHRSLVIGIFISK